MKYQFPIRKSLVVHSLLFVLTFASTLSFGQSQRIPPEPFPTRQKEDAAYWKKRGKDSLDEAKKLQAKRGRARNVILFVGDGMGITTITAARILGGQMDKTEYGGGPRFSGEENSLSFETFPYVALSKTYSANQQTSDSAPTMTAIITGVKTDDGVLSFDQGVTRGTPPADQKERQLETILETAERQGLSTGVVSTARLTHATPGACYAHSVERNWESDTDIPSEKRSNVKDIARQLIEFPYGNGLEVAFGGGRDKFLSTSPSEPSNVNAKRRSDGRDLVQEWKNKGQEYLYVSNEKELELIPARGTTHVLGLFSPDQMDYESRRFKDPNKQGQPSLSTMTRKAIDILSRNRKGYFLMVEGGRIDHGHHEGSAYKALTDTLEFSRAVQAAVDKVNRDDTLIIATADHSHTISMAGYPIRGNNILGLVRSNDEKTGLPRTDFDRDQFDLPFTTLSYANGPGFKEERPDLSKTDSPDPTAPDYRQDALLPLSNETHGGEDVAIFARGPSAYLIHGVQEESYIYYVMYDALNLPKRKRWDWKSIF